ncbi:hypothetical protein OUZ56_008648 [Daphnia magna]|uniref:Uncharacterized protein n=1 Tax=Daphnia magna TaxID=35525 RepID=A0ABR0ADL5_9CRUS|nr:hypothetical protein OUZ56_008648 [Daphnia magna]
MYYKGIYSLWRRSLIITPIDIETGCFTLFYDVGAFKKLKGFSIFCLPAVSIVFYVYLFELDSDRISFVYHRRAKDGPFN